MPAKVRRATSPEQVPAKLIAGVSRRLAESKRVRRTLPVWGRIHIDRPIPFLCLYRRPARGNHEGAQNLVTSEASYMICSGQKRLHDGVAELVQGVCKTLVEQFGTCLLLEIWESPIRGETMAITTAQPRPAFRIVETRGASCPDVTDGFGTALSRMRLGSKKAHVVVVTSARSCPGAMRPLLTASAAAGMGCLLYGLEVAPIYRDPESGDVFPLILRRLRRGLSTAVKRALYRFAHSHTTHHPLHFHTLGRRAVVKAVWEVDRLLAEACDQFDFLLQVTPLNVEQAWRDFKRHRYGRLPVFQYRPLPADPIVMKRMLYRAPVERVEDPALAQVFMEKVFEVDREITMLQERNSPGFLHESMQLFGGVEETLAKEAGRILNRIPPRSREKKAGGILGAKEVARLVRWEIDHLRQQDPTVTSTVEIRSDVAGIMVSRGNVLLGDHLRVPASRVDALLQHEVGTHVLTFHNGYSQPFRQLHTGLAGYDTLQEGLAVLSEYLVGGFTRPRLRLLAARVVAVRLLIEGASFLDTYRALVGAHGFARRTAFMVAMRVHRGGGITKDAVYLRGLCKLLTYLGQGGGLGDLLVGKIGFEHVAIVRELMWRGVLRESPLVPRYMGRPDVETKLRRLRHGVSALNLVGGREQ
jgi:uncharacterized protein (TIGR02421 family)